VFFTRFGKLIRPKMHFIIFGLIDYINWCSFVLAKPQPGTVNIFARYGLHPFGLLVHTSFLRSFCAIAVINK